MYHIGCDRDAPWTQQDTAPTSVSVKTAHRTSPLRWLIIPTISVCVQRVSLRQPAEALEVFHETIWRIVQMHSVLSG
jgi:hypothetical protein